MDVNRIGGLGVFEAWCAKDPGIEREAAVYQALLDIASDAWEVIMRWPSPEGDPQHRTMWVERAEVYLHLRAWVAAPAMGLELIEIVDLDTSPF